MAFKLQEDKLKLVNLVSASLFAAPRFNQAGDEKAGWIAEMVRRVAEHDPEFILKLALYVRDDLNVRSTANFMLALAANIPGCAPYLKKYYHKAVRLPSDWLDVAALYQILPDRSLSGRALPKCLRTAMAKKFQQFDAYQLGKYNKENSMKRKRRKLKLAAEKCVAEGKTPPRIPERQLTIKQMIRQLHISQPVPHVMCIIGKKYPSDLIGFRDCGLSGNFDETRAGKRMKLPVPETWETVISARGNCAAAWEELIDNRKLPFMAMLRNLRNLILTGISPRHHRWVMSRLCDENTVANCRQFPFSFFSAYEAVDIDLDELAADVAVAREEKAARKANGKGKPAPKRSAKVEGEEPRRAKKVLIPKVMPTADLIKKYREAIDTAVKIATVHNVKPIRGTTVVFCSASEAMRTGSLSAKSVGRAKTNVEVGALLGLMCKHMCEECDFRLVSSGLKSSDPSHVAVTLKDGTILDNMSTVEGMLNRLGDGFEFPFEYIEDLIKSRKKIDNFIILSDMTIAPGYTELVGPGAAAEGIGGILRKYRQEINPDLLYVSVNLAARKSIITDTIDESKKHPNDVLISGFSDAILRFVAEKGDGNQLDYIQNIDVIKDLDRLTAKLDKRFNKRKVEAQTSTFWSFMDKVQVCKYVGCGRKVKAELLDKHHADCDFCPVQCPEEGCEEMLPSNQLALHSDVCLFRDMAKSTATQWRTVKVFVSSTFRDMHGERDVLARFVFPEIREFCKAKNIHFFEVDLRWGVTEEECQVSGSAIDTCLGEVDRCRPFFIGLLGDRYGWAPEKYVVSEDPRFSWVKDYPAGRSITELEMEYGALRAGGQNVGSLFFVRDNSFSDKVPHDLKADFVATECDKEKLAALRSKVLENARCVEYEAQWGGVVDAKPMAGGLERFKELAIQRLKEDIIALFPDEEDGHVTPLGLEAQIHGSFLEARSRRFVGRKDVIAQMFRFADDYKTAGRRGPMVIHGAPGMGKTAVMARFCREYGEKRPGALILSHFVGCAPGSTDIRHTLFRLCSTLCTEYGMEEHVTVPETFDELKLLFPRLLELCAFGRPLVIVIDALNQFSAANRAHSLDWMPAASQLPVPVFVSTYTDAPSYAALRPRQPPLPFKELEPLVEEEAKQLVRQTLFEYRKVLEEKASNNQMRTLLRKTEANKPLWLTIACEELRMFGVYEQVSNKIKSLPPKVTSLLDSVLLRLEGDHGKEMVSSALTLIHCARGGLSEGEILVLLAPEGSAKLPLARWAAIRRGLESLLRFVGHGADSALDFLHEEMAAAVSKRYLRLRGKETEVHTRLAAFFAARADPDGSGNFATCQDARAIRELPFHLLQAQKTAEVEALLCNLEFVQCKCSLGMVYELLEDVTAAKAVGQESQFLSFGGDNEVSRLDELYSFLSSNAHILSQEPHLTLQQAANEPDSSFLAQLAGAALQEKDGRFAWNRWLNKPQVHGTCKLTLSGFSESMMACAFSPDGSEMVCASRDRTLTTYDTATGTEKANFPGHTHWVVACAYAPHGGNIVSASWDNTLRVWDGQLGTTLLTLKGHRKKVSACSYSPAGDSILSGSWDCTVRLWHSGTGACQQTMKGHVKPITAVGFSPDGLRGVSASWDTTIRVWDLETGKCTAVLRGHSQSIRSVTFAPNNRQVISTSTDCSIRIWDVDRKRTVQTITGHSQPVNSCTISLDGKHLVSASDDQTVRVWDALGGSEVRSMALGGSTFPSSIAISADGKTILSGSSDCKVLVWDARTTNLSGTLEGHTRVVTSVSFNADSSWIASTSEDRSVRIWDAATMRLVVALEGHTDTVQDVAFRPARPRELVTVSDDFSAIVWTLDAAGAVLKKIVLSGHTGAVLSCCFSPNGRDVVTSGRDGTIRVWAAETGKHTMTLRGHKDWVTRCAFSANGRNLASVSWDFNAKIWDMSTGKEVHALTGHQGGVTDCAWSADGKLLVTASFDGTLKLWDVADGVLVTSMLGHRSRVNGCAWREKGATIVSSSDDGTIRIWDAVAGTEVAALQGHSSTVHAVDLSADKKQIVSASQDRTVKVWSASVSRVGSSSYDDVAADGAPDPVIQQSHKEAVTSIAFTADGLTAYSASRDKSLMCWDAETGATVESFEACMSTPATATCLLPAHGLVAAASVGGTIGLFEAAAGEDFAFTTASSSTITALAASSDGKKLVSASWDHTVRVWDVSNRANLKESKSWKHQNWVNDCAISDCGSTVMSASHDRTVRLWGSGAGAHTAHCVTSHKNWVLGCDFLPGSNHRGASVGYDGSVHVWDAVAGATVADLKGHSERVNRCSFLDENILVTVSHDRTARMWDIRVGADGRQKSVAMFHARAPLLALDVHRGKKRMALGDSLGNVYFLDLTRV